MNKITSPNRRLLLFAAALPLIRLTTGCGAASASATSSSTTTTSENAYATAYKNVSWSSAASVSYPTDCSMTFKTTGVPPYHADYYLAPTSTAYPTTVAYTPVSKTAMSLVPYLPADITSNTVTINTCTAKAASNTSANMGVIGYMLSGEAIYNPYEGNGASTPAMSDNVSYTFTTSAGVSETASFIDTCNSHPTPISGGYTWHHHGIPTCLVSQVDGTSGPSHIIGFALDGFPIYGGRDINGNTISVSQLDSCNGITSATPEFPNGAYHYVLPIGVTGSQSSLNCYAGTVSQTEVAKAVKLKCTMKGM
jgi:hypothetical protein